VGLLTGLILALYLEPIEMEGLFLMIMTLIFALQDLRKIFKEFSNSFLKRYKSP